MYKSPGNGSLVVHVAEENELLVDKVRVVDRTRVLLVQVDFRQLQLAPSLTYVEKKLSSLTIKDK